MSKLSEAVKAFIVEFSLSRSEVDELGIDAIEYLIKKREDGVSLPSSSKNNKGYRALEDICENR